MPFAPQQLGEQRHSLLLLPGKPGEILVRVSKILEQIPRSRSNTPVLWLEVDGNFPENWCKWQQSESSEQQNQSSKPWRRQITNTSDAYEHIVFEVPQDFFEAQSSLTVQQQQLQLNYTGYVALYVEWRDRSQSENDQPFDKFADNPSPKQLAGYQPFELCIQPPRSYLDFLPDIYRQSDFMGRFLSIFEQAFDPSVEMFETLWSYLDPLTAPETLLPFLAEWVAWEMNPKWPLKQQRRLIRNAVEIYRWRGTRRGLRLYLHLYTGLPLDDDHIAIEEE